MKFDCDKCGKCCLYVSCVPEMEHLAGENGCVHLKDNLCEIYETRPDICRVDKQWKNSGMSKKEYYRKSKLGCQQLKNL